MGRLGTFFFGFLLGGAVVYWSLHYHVVRARDGFHVVPKLTSTFSESYVDIRFFGLQEWNEHRELAYALTKADKVELLQGVATGEIQNAANQVFEMIDGATR